jgi:hypothetical protein
MEEMIPYKISGLVLDKNTDKPIPNVKVYYSTASTTTNPKGEFTLSGVYSKDEKISLNFTISGYDSLFNQNVYTLSGKIKHKVIFKLKPLDNNSYNKDVSSSLQMSDEQVNSILKSKKDASYYIQKRLTGSINDLKSKILPNIIKIAYVFGISNLDSLLKLSKFDQQKYIDTLSCPPKDKLDKIIKDKNTLVRKINQTLTIINTTTKAVGITGGIIEALNIATKVLIALPVPVAIAGVGIPMNVITAVQQAIPKLQQQISKLRSINTGVLITLITLQQTLSQILQYLSLLDMMTQHCYPDAEQERVSAELTALTQQQSQQQSPVVTNVNGFEMGVETEDTTKSLKRRRAIAKNAQGIVMLKGEWSFSSIDQILIDELVFYIQQNNLKAY